MAYGHPFVDMLASLRSGVFLDEAAEELVDLIEEIQKTGKAGKLVLTLQIKPPGKNVDTPVIWISDQLKVSAPTAERGDTMFYAVDGEISRRDPRQPSLEDGIRALPSTKSEQDGDEAARSEHA